MENDTGREHLYKVLRVLAQHSILDETKERSFAANAATGDLVQGDKPSLGHMAAHLINAPKWDAWKLLPEAVKTGGTAFAMAHDGNDVYQVCPAMSHTPPPPPPLMTCSASISQLLSVIPMFNSRVEHIAVQSLLSFSLAGRDRAPLSHFPSMKTIIVQICTTHGPIEWCNLEAAVQAEDVARLDRSC